ncbi:MAG: FliA/WhiG family RNA polymerase sigma factor [Desulfovermiculus sp.]
MNPGLDAYQRPHDEHRNRLVTDHMHLINFWVNRMAPQVPLFMSRDDLMSAAMEGLNNAAQRFDPQRGFMFKTFAEHRIRGAIYDEVRRMDWFSRSMREKHQHLTQTIRELEIKLGRSPGEIEIAQAMGLTLAQYQDLLSKVSYLGCVSLNEIMDQESEEGLSFLENMSDEKERTPEESLQHTELVEELAKHLQELSSKERTVIALYYHEGLTQKEIAEVMSLTEGRISQLHSQALAKLRAKMELK